MKKLLITLALCLGLASTPVFTGCSTTASRQVVQAKTLLVVGRTAKAAVDTASTAVTVGDMSVAHYLEVADFYDNKFQPAYRLAVAANALGQDGISSDEVNQLAAQLGALVLSYSGGRPTK